MTRDAIQGALLVTMVMIAECHSARILCLLPFPSKSHRFVFSSLVQELVDRGHHVTVVSAYNQIPAHQSYTEIIYKDEWREEHNNKSLYWLKDQNVLGKLLVLWKIGLHTCEKVLQHPEVEKLLLHCKDQHFDLILIEAFFNECLLGFAHKFRAPTVHICSHGGIFWMGDYVGNPSPHAYVPDVFFDFSDKMTFRQRVWNTLAALFARVGRELWYLPKQDALMRRYFKSDDLPSVWEIQSNTSAVMLNSHVAVNYPRPLMPNLLLVGGMHIKKPGQLPQDLQQYLDEAPNGVIYFSMGTNLQSSLMPESKRNAFLGAFSKLKQKVLLKWETDSLPGQPSNVKLAKWLPQSDILAHPNIRLFVTHGGMMSTQEAVYRGIPLVGIPIFSDQLLNIRQASAAGYALHLDYDNITDQSVHWAIQQVLNVPKYRENAQRISRIFRDNPTPPLELASYWIEYIIRHKGTAHLRSSSLDLYWYQYFLLDVISVLFLAVLTFIGTLYLMCRVFVKRINYKSDTKNKND